MTRALVYIAALNDSSGNPRRGWIVDYGSREAFFVDEGYSGRQALRAFGIDPALGDLPRIPVPASEYRYWVRKESPVK